jgi:hypothetical protein
MADGRWPMAGIKIGKGAFNQLIILYKIMHVALEIQAFPVYV